MTFDQLYSVTGTKNHNVKNVGLYIASKALADAAAEGDTSDEAFVYRMDMGRKRQVAFACPWNKTNRAFHTALETERELVNGWDF